MKKIESERKLEVENWRNEEINSMMKIEKWKKTRSEKFWTSIQLP